MSAEPSRKRARLEEGTPENPIEVNTEDTSVYWSDEDGDIWIEGSSDQEFSDSGQDDDDVSYDST